MRHFITNLNVMQQKASEQEAENAVIPTHPFLEQFLEFAHQNPEIKEKLMVFKAIAAIPGQNHRLFLIGNGKSLSYNEKVSGTEIHLQTNILLSPNEKKFILSLTEEDLNDYLKMYSTLFQKPLTTLV